ncbi:solute carrier family 22 member 23 isoform X9 [Pan troglodytes]|uniref:solute carrier family 22 member 23 isoform X9 n=1 Tax=Pan troglodytes TaxID=9598 RepID=UPI0023F34346|nr:solute carrier family 22 member 23 isoform X7 [Pan troglodytes]
MAIDRRREAAGGGPGRQPAPAEENGSLPPGDAAASAPLGGRAGPGGGAEIQPLPPLHPGGGPHPSCCSAAAAPSLLLLDYDGSVLPFLGGLGGGYQKTLVLLTWIPALFIGFSQFSDSFLLDQPNFWCRGAGKGTELAGVTTTGRGGDMGNWTSLPTTPFATAPWEAAGNRSNSSGADGGDTPPLPSPPDKGDNASNCDCHAWDYGIRAGLVQNVVSKWDLVCDNAWKVHIAKFSLLVGLIFGYLITGCIADWNRAVPPWKTVHDYDGGELRGHGGPVPHARASRPVPGLAGAAGPHHLPLPAHAALLVVSTLCTAPWAGATAHAS